MKTAIADELFVISLKHVLRLTGHVNLPGTRKMWVIPLENDNKLRKRRVLGGNSHTYAPDLTVVVNIPRTPNLWTIDHENGHKCENNKFWLITLKHVSG